MTDPVREHFVNLEEFRGQLRRLGVLAGQVLETAAKAGALPICNAAADKAPKRTGTLMRSIHIEVLESGQFFCWVAIGTNLKYAAIHEFGGVIVPKPDNPTGYLHFRTQDGQWHMVKSVTIPARPYLRPAWDENIDKTVTEMVIVLKQQLERTR